MTVYWKKSRASKVTFERRIDQKFSFLSELACLKPSVTRHHRRPQSWFWCRLNRESLILKMRSKSAPEALTAPSYGHILKTTGKSEIIISTTTRFRPIKKNDKIKINLPANLLKKNIVRRLQVTHGMRDLKMSQIIKINEKSLKNHKYILKITF